MATTETIIKKQADAAYARGTYSPPEIPTVYECVENCHIPPAPRSALEPTGMIPRATEGFKADSGFAEQAVAMAGAALIVGIFALFWRRK